MKGYSLRTDVYDDVQSEKETGSLEKQTFHLRQESHDKMNNTTVLTIVSLAVHKKTTKAKQLAWLKCSDKHKTPTTVWFIWLSSFLPYVLFEDFT